MKKFRLIFFINYIKDINPKEQNKKKICEAKLTQIKY